MAKKKTYQDQAKKVAYVRKRRAFLKKFVSRLFTTFIICLILSIAWLGYTGKIKQLAEDVTSSALQSTVDAGFNLKTVYVEGLSHLTDSEISHMLPVLKTPIFSISLRKLKHEIESMGWVEEASIHRKLPDTLFIEIIERSPRAIWQYQGKLSLIDKKGNIIVDNSNGDSDVWVRSGLPLLVGEDANRHANMLLTFMSEEPELMRKVSSIIRIGSRRWNVRLDNGIEIKLPEENPDVAWRKLAQMHRDERVLDRAIKDIDLRIKDRLFILPDNEI